MMKLIACLVYIVYVTQIPEVAAFTSEDAQKIDNFINGLMQCAGIPGMSFSMVQDNQVLMSKGYGVADLETNTPVTNKTKFMVASISKAFSSTLLAKIISQHSSVNWDTPVRQILGDWFYFKNGFQSNETTLRDIVAHKTGIPRNDFIWTLNAMTRQELVRRIRFLSPVQEFRTRFLYTNNMHTLAGYVAETLEGTSWEDSLRRNLLNPLNMADTLIVHEGSPSYDGFVSNYLLAPDGQTPLKVPYEAQVGAGIIAAPAAGVVSTAEDMAKWMKFHISGGKSSNGTEVISESALKRTKQPEFIVPETPTVRPVTPVEYTKVQYALGWNNGYYRGHPMVQHGGSMPGVQSLLSFLSAKNIGVFISGNTYSAWQNGLITQFAFDIALGLTPILDLPTACNTTVQRDFHNDNVAIDFPQYFVPTPKQVNKNISPRRPIQNYAGVYGNFGYGNITIIVGSNNNTLELSYGSIGRYQLMPTAIEDVFSSEAIGPAWIWQIGDVAFSASNNSTNIVDRLDIPQIEVLDPPFFIRDLKLADAPAPPTDNC